MIQNDRDPQVEPFPTKLIGIAALTTLAVLAWLSWFIYDEYQIVQDTNTRIVGLERVRGDIVHLDEVLTMSASMAAATGEVAWIERYRDFEPKLDTAIKKAIDIARRPDIADAIRETDAANIELVRMENQAFELVRERKLEEARAILSGKRYSDHKQVYASGMEKLLRGLGAEREAAVGSQRTSTLGSILAMAAVAAVIIVAWLLILGRVREWRAVMTKNVSDLVRAEEALRKSHDDLEQRVTDRTRELEDEIAERKRAEEAVRENQQLLDTILHHMPAPVYLRDAGGRFKLANRKYEEVHDVDNEKIRGKTLHEVFPKIRADEYASLDAEVLKHHRVQEGEERHGLGEDERTLAVVRFPIFDIAGDAVGVGGVDIDITDRKRMEKEALAARDSAAEARVLLTDAIENISEGFVLYDSDERLQLCNSKFRDFYNYGEADVTPGTKYEDLARLDFERGVIADEDGQLKNYVDRRIAYLKEEKGSFEVKLADGRWILIHERSTSVGGRVGVQADITELKRAEKELAEKEAQLRVALDNMPGGMMLVDRDLNYVLFNSQYSELYEFPDGLVRVGGSSLDETRFQAERGDYGPGDKDELIEQVVAIYQRGEAVSYERAIADSGRTLQVYLAPTPEGGCATIVSDITERKRAEEELAEKEAQLRVALDNMPGGIRFVDEDRNYVFFNSRYLELYEFPKGLFKVGKHCRIENLYQAKRGDFGPGDPEALTDDWLGASERGKAVSYEREIAGSGRTLQVYAAPTPEGGYVNIVTDITERKRAEEALQAANGIIKAQKERMESELNVGREIQMSFVPDFSSLPDHAEFSICAALEPAREVGGDFYDSYFLDEERFCFCIADVSGKGVPAALFMAMAKTLIKSRAGDDRSIASILTHVNDELSADNQACMFVTVFAGILNIRSGELVYTNAGHNPPYIRKKDGTLRRLDQRHGPAIGAMEGMVYKEERDRLQPGDLLFLYTDGVTEAIDTENHLFTEDRLKDLLTAKGTKGAQTAVDHTVAAVRAFEGEAEQTDDITVLALEFHGRPEDALRAE
jgi:PAS domain S-box-containing protein